MPRNLIHKKGRNGIEGGVKGVSREGGGLGGLRDSWGGGRVGG